MSAEPIRILLRVAGILEELAILYLTGGSVASSIFGIPRATQDIDLVVDLPEAKVESFVHAMKGNFYIDHDTVTQAVRRCSSFNAIHFETVQKIDFFVRDQSDFAHEEMRRRIAVVVDDASQSKVFLASPEDIILQKLVWYRMGARISERQWNDVLGVVKVQGERLDRAYISRWAGKLSVADLVEEVWRSVSADTHPPKNRNREF
jgi:hypothetical protein